MGVNDTRIGEDGNARIRGIEDSEARHLSLVQAFNTTTTTLGATIALFAIDALGSPKRDIKLTFFLDDDAAATFTVTLAITRLGDPTTFVSRTVVTIATPAADAQYGPYDLGDLGEDMQAEVRIAQAAGDATNVIDAVLSWEE